MKGFKCGYFYFGFYGNGNIETGGSAPNGGDNYDDALLMYNSCRRIYFVGETTGYVGTEVGSMIGTKDAIVASFPSTLSAPNWVKQMGVPSYDTKGNGIAIDATGDQLLIVGISGGNMIAGSGAVSSGYDTAFVKQISTSGTVY